MDPGALGSVAVPCAGMVADVAVAEAAADVAMSRLREGAGCWNGKGQNCAENTSSGIAEDARDREAAVDGSRGLARSGALSGASDVMARTLLWLAVEVEGVPEAEARVYARASCVSECVGAVGPRVYNGGIGGFK